MSDDLVLWRWGKARHVSAATCFLLTAEGFECEDAAVLDGDRLQDALVHELSGTPGSVDCNASSRALVVEAHGVEPTRLRTIVRAFAQSEDLVVFDPQVDPVSGADRSAAEALMRRIASEDERARCRADLPELVPRAEQGDAGALVDLGNRYFFGEGTGTDVSRAFHCYRRAAEAGNEAGTS